jgi:hypothetical protein
MSMLIMFFVPIWTKVDTATLHTYTMYAWRFQETNPIDNLGHTDFIPYIFIGTLASIAILIALYEIFRYDNRMAQLKLGALNGLLMTGIIGLVVYLAMKNETKLLAGVAGQYKLGFILPAIAIVSNLIANRLIKRDEKLVRSVDKIR